MQPGDEQVGMAVVVVVAHGHAHAVSASPGDRGDAGFLGHVLEGAVAAVAEEPIAGGRSASLPGPPARAAQGSALDAIDVEPAVAVEVEQADAARHRLGQQVLRGLAVVEDEAKAGGLGVVDEFRAWPARLAGVEWPRCGAPGRWRRGLSLRRPRSASVGDRGRRARSMSRGWTGTVTTTPTPFRRQVVGRLADSWVPGGGRGSAGHLASRLGDDGPAPGIELRPTAAAKPRQLLAVP